MVGGDRTDILFYLIRSLSLLPSLNHYYNNPYHSLLVALTDSLRYQHQHNSSSSLVAPPPPHPFPSLPLLFHLVFFLLFLFCFSVFLFRLDILTYTYYLSSSFSCCSFCVLLILRRQRYLLLGIETTPCVCMVYLLH